MKTRIVKTTYGNEVAYRGQIMEVNLTLGIEAWKDVTPLIDRTCVTGEGAALEWCKSLLDLEVIRRGGGEREYIYGEEKGD